MVREVVRTSLPFAWLESWQTVIPRLMCSSRKLFTVRMWAAVWRSGVSSPAVFSLSLVSLLRSERLWSAIVSLDATVSVRELAKRSGTHSRTTERPVARGFGTHATGSAVADRANEPQVRLAQPSLSRAKTGTYILARCRSLERRCHCCS